jgi:acyl dehydratase
MRTFQGLAELEEAIGTHLGYSGWHVVTQRQIDLFAEATGDHQWIHVDPDRAAAGPFGTTIAHGYLTLSLIPTLARQVYTVEGLRMSVNYGTQRVRFPAPVPAEARIRAGLELMSLTTTARGWQLVARVTIERDGSDKPVCVADTISMLAPAVG